MRLLLERSHLPYPGGYSQSDLYSDHAASNDAPIAKPRGSKEQWAECLARQVALAQALLRNRPVSYSTPSDVAMLIAG